VRSDFEGLLAKRVIAPLVHVRRSDGSTLEPPRFELGAESAHLRRFFSLPCHDPAGGWIRAGGGVTGCRDEITVLAPADVR
jgi:hypothetical protein